MSHYQFELFMVRLREQSRQYSTDGEVSYEHIAGMLEMYLRNAVGDNQYVREAVIDGMKETL